MCGVVQPPSVYVCLSIYMFVWLGIVTCVVTCSCVIRRKERDNSREPDKSKRKRKQ